MSEDRDVVGEPGGLGRPGTPGVNLVGHLEAHDGLGEAARQLAGALEAQGLDCARIEAAEANGAAPHRLNLLCLNPHQLPGFAARAGERFFAGRPTAGLWWWENPDFPSGLGWAFDYLDEVWVASSFIAAALEPSAPIPVRRIDLPVIPVPPAAADRDALGLPPGFLFLFVFDYLSAARKNPLGAIEAFRRAFEPGSGAALALKSWNASRNPAAARRVREAAAGHPDVHLIERSLPEAEKNAMIASCDCYLSLHRAEGFGLTIAEAMYFERPVIATGWSGNQELMDGRTSYAVSYGLRPVGADAWPYRSQGSWAEPDLDHAAGLMRGVFERPPEAAELGRLAGERMRRERSAAAAGRGLVERVMALAASGPRPRPPLPPQASQRARRMVERGPEPSRRGRGNPLRFLRRALLRLLRPQTAHQQEVDREILEAVSELERRVEELEGRARP
jgi:glycosyltransferase involved in cell wall biosynthesis